MEKNLQNPETNDPNSFIIQQETNNTDNKNILLCDSFFDVQKMNIPSLHIAIKT